MLFVVAAEAEPQPATGRVIGIDWDVKETVTTTSDAHDLPHVQHGRTAAQKLAQYQRMSARRKPAEATPGSNGYKTAKRQVAKQHKKVARLRQDTVCKRGRPQFSCRGRTGCQLPDFLRSAPGFSLGVKRMLWLRRGVSRCRAALCRGRCCPHDGSAGVFRLGRVRLIGSGLSVVVSPCSEP